ncbi:MarR family transcriptional regulator [Neorhizobium sp. Rsf11]|uniref:MarR family transcriptional regulator n=2 Tax=Neorhizobium TaxID=1525371 RepID=A0ABV0M971_9HYPH|nr:MarR family transcriptional regulator [Neorhizobium petrolearium]MCC2613091.1 MarR family transcriptional regulator [Neorhizobium petrolearium]WGI68187.1 MarR family transcriptional regulator [Neorhizobium petrolearium]
MDMPIRTTDEVNLDRLDTALGFLMRLAQLKIYERFFEEVGDHNLKPGEFSVLWVLLHNPGIRQSVLGQRLMIKRAHMTKLIRSLEDQGLVSRRIPDDDRRAVEITLTPAAATMVEQAGDWFFTYEDSVGENLNAAERRQLTALLRKFVGLG